MAEKTYVFNRQTVQRLRDVTRIVESRLVGDGPQRRDIHWQDDPEVHLFEIAEDILEEGEGVPASAWRLLRVRDSFVRADTVNGEGQTVVWAEGPTATQIKGVFRGAAWGYGGSSGFSGSVINGAGASVGDIVAAIYVADDDDDFRWVAISGGRVVHDGIAQQASAAGATSIVLNTMGLSGDGRTVRVYGTALNAIAADDVCVGIWDSGDCRWKHFSLTAAELEAGCHIDAASLADRIIKVTASTLAGPGLMVVEGEDGCDKLAVDPDGPCCKGDGGGGNGFPNNEECPPDDCCPADAAGATVEGCEEFDLLFEQYKAVLPELSCCPEGSGEQIVDYVSDCVFESATPFNCTYDGGADDHIWRLTVTQDRGSTWQLIRLSDPEVVVLEWLEPYAFCWRCANKFRLYCPSIKCEGITEWICVRPVCEDCAYTPNGCEDDWDAGSFTEETIAWGAGNTNTSSSAQEDFDGDPFPPCLEISLSYGTAALTADGVAHIVYPDSWPTFDPVTCDQPLKSIRAVSFNVKWMEQTAIYPEGIEFGLVAKQDGDVFVYPLGSTTDPGWIAVDTANIVEGDFQLLSTSGFSAGTPDFSVLGDPITFGIAIWAADTASEDWGDITSTAVLRLDHGCLTLCHDECAEGPPIIIPGDYTCGETIHLGGICVGGAVELLTIPIENGGGTPMTVESIVVSWSPAIADLVTITGEPGTPFTLDPGESASPDLILSIATDTAAELDGLVRITTDVGVCEFPFTASIVECTVANGSCVGKFDAFEGAVAATPISDWESSTANPPDWDHIYEFDSSDDPLAFTEPPAAENEVEATGGALPGLITGANSDGGQYWTAQHGGYADCRIVLGVEELSGSPVGAVMIAYREVGTPGSNARVSAIVITDVPAPAEGVWHYEEGEAEVSISVTGTFPTNPGTPFQLVLELNGSSCSLWLIPVGDAATHGPDIPTAPDCTWTDARNVGSFRHGCGANGSGARIDYWCVSTLATTHNYTTIKDANDTLDAS